MRIPLVERKHMDRALQEVLKISDKYSLKDMVRKENAGIIKAMQEQVEIMMLAEESEEYIQSFVTGFYSCYFLIREAMRDESLN